MAAVDPRDDPASVVAADRVLLELWTILAGFADAMTIVGGSAPPLLTGDRPEDPYVGTLDVDLVVDPISVPDEAYRTIAELLRERGYVQLDHPFRWLRSVEIDLRSIDVEVDLLAPTTPRSGGGHRHERIGGEPLARRTEGAELVRSGHVEREISGVLPDGRRHRVAVRVATPAALVILKALAMGQRDKPKDAYDIDYVLRHIGVEEVAAGIHEFGEVEPVRRALDVLAEKFISIDAIGPTSVALYRRVPLGSPEADQVQALAYARVDQLRRLII
ncbi:MAG: nucleotidyl transferase AbiEii/AbiGii toxin family protein [Candidatus Limnocylindria bacterium]